jgi:hypothetical protein
MSAESRPSPRFSFNAAATRARADFGARLDDVVFLDVNQKRAALNGAPQTLLKDAWLATQVMKTQRKRGSFVDYKDGKTFCFIYTGEDRRALLGHIENLHLTFSHELGHALDPDLSKKTYGANSPYHETVADCYAALDYLKNFPDDVAEIEHLINERDLSHTPYDTGEELKRAVTFAKRKDLTGVDGPSLFRQAQRIAAPKRKPI